MYKVLCIFGVCLVTFCLNISVINASVEVMAAIIRMAKYGMPELSLVSFGYSNIIKIFW